MLVDFVLERVVAFVADAFETFFTRFRRLALEDNKIDFVTQTRGADDFATITTVMLQ